MDITSIEQKLFEIPYPEGCSWNLLFREISKGSTPAWAWWSTNLRPEGGLYLVTRISEYGQLASALKTEETVVESEDKEFFHYSKYPDHLHKVIGALWARAWGMVVDSLKIRLSSPILQEWITTLDTFEGGTYFQAAHDQYLLMKQQEAMLKDSFKKDPFKKMAPPATSPQQIKPRKTSPPKAPRKPRVHRGRKPKTTVGVDWNKRWNQQ